MESMFPGYESELRAFDYEFHLIIELAIEIAKDHTLDKIISVNSKIERFRDDLKASKVKTDFLNYLFENDIFNYSFAKQLSEDYYNEKKLRAACEEISDRINEKKEIEIRKIEQQLISNYDRRLSENVALIEKKALQI
jgi:hypothetical protein